MIPSPLSDVFGDSQQHIAFLLENSGMQFGSYVYHSFDEALSILRQVTISLAIAEEALQFEHRDMHRGNVLVKRTKEEFIYFRLNRKEYYIRSHGVRATIVDFTLSRITQRDSHCLSHQDLNNMPWLFKGKGDIQFDVYRNMRNATKSQWQKFTPYTNVLWINYLTIKTKIKGKLKGIHSKVWESKFKPYLRSILKYKSVKDVFLNVFHPDKPLRHSTSHHNSSSRHHPV
jgi:serine/threonine-protein kinase haspin